MASAARATTGERRGRQAPPMLLAVIACIESVVVDTAARPFARFYAWYRLVRHWSAMRFDDTLGVCPGSITERARGIAGCLERSKTSGPGKAMRVLPFFVSDEAWVRERDWLRTGLAVLRESFGGAMVYLLPGATSGESLCDVQVTSIPERNRVAEKQCQNDVRFFPRSLAGVKLSLLLTSL